MNLLNDDLIRTYQEDRLRAARAVRRPSGPRNRRSTASTRIRLSIRFAHARPEETL
jgi:hypothetical protein